MTETEAITILARWVYELQVDLLITQAELELAETRNDDLQAIIDQYAFWVHSGLTPRDIVQAGNQLDPAAVGAA